ncbi:hypothetical protein ESA_03040 [Cronobacter sakazakii ATCC BAA-894]|uniref:Uncharacterized protein n=1 Tax=Cronobacter sakazakii (strain ATCC BAA-894) TaxID=290339 RepID=A7MN19_CROS8|nr:hypothetical protein ESA_03040 [Cronobacter sakazakii ATCC BAA-894]
MIASVISRIWALCPHQFLQPMDALSIGFNSSPPTAIN